MYLNNEINIENYKVALADLILPCKIKNVSPNNNKILIGYRNIHENAIDKEEHLDEIKIGHQNYESVESLIDSINENVNAAYGEVDELDYKKRSIIDRKFLKLENSKVTITQEFKKFLDVVVDEAIAKTIGSWHFECIVKIQNRLALMLGFPPNENILDIQPKTCNLELGLPQEIFIYSDILDLQYVGEFLSPLLKVIPFNFEPKDLVGFGKRLHFQFVKRQFIDVCKNSMRTLKIEIRDSSGSHIPFEDGSNVTLVLHFSHR